MNTHTFKHTTTLPTTRRRNPHYPIRACQDQHAEPGYTNAFTAWGRR